MLSDNLLKEIIIDQKTQLYTREIGIARKKEILPTTNFAIILTGIRRCGKSTLLNQVMHKQRKGYYLNLEDPRLEGFELSDFTKVEKIMKELYGEEGIYFFDEIQVISEWEKFIRYLVDKKEKIVLTGSNASLLSRELGTKLTGRHIQIELFPFSFKEFLKIKKKKSSAEIYAEYMYTGGFPEYVKKKDIVILHQLLSDVIIRDVVVRYGIRNHNLLNKIAIYLISNVGKEFSYNSIKNMFNIKSLQTVIDYISYLENSYLIFTIPMFNYSYKKQQINPKKVYAIDNGFSYANSASFSKDKGKMLENSIFLELRREYKNIFYYHSNKHECDFVIKEKEKIVSAIQVCYDLNEENMEREIGGLLEAMNEFNLKEGLIITFDEEDSFVKDKKKIKVIPAWKWLLQK